MPQEKINHPDHYGGDTPYETIKVLEAWMTPQEVIGFCKGNAIKYLSRAGKKDGNHPADDFRKAAWYSSHAAGLIEDIVRDIEARSGDA